MNLLILQVLVKFRQELADHFVTDVEDFVDCAHVPAEELTEFVRLLVHDDYERCIRRENEQEISK